MIGARPVPPRSGPLALPDLLNDAEALAGLMVERAQRGDWLNAYLLAAGLNQVAEDGLAGADYGLEKAALRLARHGAVGRAAGRALAAVCGVLTVISFGRGAAQGLVAWQRDLDNLVQHLADRLLATDEAGNEKAGTGATCPREPDGRWLASCARQLPAELRRKVLRLPSCFRSFDQRPADVEELCRRFAARWADPEQPLVVVGLRTSGSYLAPLVAAALRRLGYRRVAVATVRPGQRLAPRAQAALSVVRRQDGLVLLVDDPPNSGASLDVATRQVRRSGFTPERIVLLLPLFGPKAEAPRALRAYPCVALPEPEWAAAGQLQPAAVAQALAALLDPRVRLRQIEEVSAPPRSRARAHLRARFRARVVHPGDREETLEVYVKGVGLGYFGDHALAVATPLRAHLPRVLGVCDGFLYREWLPEERRVRDADLDPGQVANYVAARARALPAREDAGLRLPDRDQVWWRAAQALGRAFGRVGALLRPPLACLTRRLLQVERPSVIDGATAPAHWFRTAQGRLAKVTFEERAFSNVAPFCYDPAYDLAGAATGALLASAQRSELQRYAQEGSVPGSRALGLGEQLRHAYLAQGGANVDDERWLLYQLVYLEQALDLSATPESHVRRAQARVLAGYLERRFFQGVVPAPDGPLCAIDLDGVLETGHLRFSSASPTAALSLRALLLHGYRPVLVTGRSLDEVCDRCQAYHLPGGVAEYGAAMYDPGARTVGCLLSVQQRRSLEALRHVLERFQGVVIDPAFRYILRAHHRDARGRPVGLDRRSVAQALDAIGARGCVRPVRGRFHTDFVPLGVDKAAGLRALAQQLGAPWPDGHPLALAVGDAEEDLPMLALASLACAPGNASPSLAAAGVRALRGRYGAGLAEAVARLLGHAPGACARCRPPAARPEAQLLLALLDAPVLCPWAKARRALLVAAALRRGRRS